MRGFDLRVIFLGFDRLLWAIFRGLDRDFLDLNVRAILRDFDIFLGRDLDRERRAIGRERVGFNICIAAHDAQ